MVEREFYKSNNVHEAVELLARCGQEARILAGGTDLIAQFNSRLTSPKVFIYIGDSGLDYIKKDGDELVIGAAAQFQKIQRSAAVQESAPLLAEVVSTIGSPSIRSAATLGGNLANASPAADSAVALLVLRARLRLASIDGERVVAVEDFFTGPGRTVLKTGEMLKEVLVPKQPLGARWAFRKIGKRRGEVCAVASAAVALALVDGQVDSVRIALGSVAPTPLLSKQAQKLLAGRRLSEDLVAEVAQAVSAETSPIDDGRATAWYRRRAVAALIQELLGQWAE